MSRLPVGSSARIIAGRVTSARAIATRCCWPPESSEGRWWTRSARPTWASAPSARVAPLRRAAGPRTPSGSSTLASASRARDQVEALEHEPDVPVAHVGERVLVDPAHVEPVQAVAPRRSACRGSRGCSSASSCRCPSAHDRHVLAALRPAAHAAQRVDGDVADRHRSWSRPPTSMTGPRGEHGGRTATGCGAPSRRARSIRCARSTAGRVTRHLPARGPAPPAPPPPKNAATAAAAESAGATEAPAAQPVGVVLELLRAQRRQRDRDHQL